MKYRGKYRLTNSSFKFPIFGMFLQGLRPMRVERLTQGHQIELQPIEEEQEHRGSREPSMTESEHRNNPNKSGSDEETKEYSICTVCLGHK
jgi:hypothetical protein